MTIRSLAAELGVAPMSLYRHVRDKDDLFDEVTDGLVAEAWRPRSRRTDWRQWTVEAADRLRALLVHEPVALHVYLQHPVVSPAAIARMDAMLEVLMRLALQRRRHDAPMARSTPTRSASLPWRLHVAKQREATTIERTTWRGGCLGDHARAVQGRPPVAARRYLFGK